MRKSRVNDVFLKAKNLGFLIFYKLRIIKYIVFCLTFVIFLKLFGQQRENLTSVYLNKEVRIFVYGTYYHEVLLPGFDNKCARNRRVDIKRGYHVTNDSDIYIVHFREYDAFMERYVRTKVEGKKILILFALESPIIVNGVFKYEKTKKYFTHWVCGYMKSSYIHYPYGSYFEKSDMKNVFNTTNIFSEKENKALVLISNCMGVETMRTHYVADLQRYFPVVTKGACYGPKINEKERAELIRKYKFYLSFENCCSEEYITEKYWNPIKHGAIAVVMASGKHLSSLIPGSFINVFDYPDTESLAKYLSFVASHETEYLKYFEWRSKYTPYEYFESDHCKVLDKIYEHLKNPIEDPTIFEIGNVSLTIPKEELRKLIMK